MTLRYESHSIELFAELDEAIARMHVRFIKGELRKQIKQARCDLEIIRSRNLSSDESLQDDIDLLNEILSELDRGLPPV